MRLSCHMDSFKHFVPGEENLPALLNGGTLLFIHVCGEKSGRDIFKYKEF